MPNIENKKMKMIWIFDLKESSEGDRLDFSDKQN